MPKRSTAGAFGYRYGFNGKENDNEVKGLGNQQDYGMRIYDARLGRFLSVDPLTEEYSELTPYQFASNRPTSSIDIDGLEAEKLPPPKPPMTVVPPNAPGKVVPMKGPNQSIIEKGIKWVTDKLSKYRKHILPEKIPFRPIWIPQPEGETNLPIPVPINEKPVPGKVPALTPTPQNPIVIAPATEPDGGDRGADEDPDDVAAVRFQVQTGKENISSDVAFNAGKVGVTKKQGYSSLKKIFDAATNADGELKDNKAFRSAIIKVSEKIKAIKGGITKGPYQTTIQETFKVGVKTYRIDVEVLRGKNFKK